MTIELNDAQRGAVESSSSLIITVAGPGSGKTKTLCERINRLIRDGQNPRRIASITFTNAAAAEIRQRLTQQIGYVGTLHSFMLRLIQQNMAVAGYACDRLTVMDENQTDDLIERAASEVGVGNSSLKTLRQAVAGVEGASPKIAIAAKRFDSICKQSGLISYDQILAIGLRVVESKVDVPFDHLLVDEFQDATDLDNRIYQRMAVKNLFFVADPDQSIFSFRGGNVLHVLTHAEAFPERVIRLEENYRSDKEICIAADSLIAHNTRRVPKETRPVSQEHGTVRVCRCPTELSEMTGILRLIDQERGSCAILVRTNSLVERWTEALLGAGVKVASRKRVDRPKDWPLLKAAVGVLNDPDNNYLAEQLIGMMCGEAEARRLSLEARSIGISLNDHRLHTPVGLPLRDYSQFIAKLGLSAESVTLLNKSLNQLPDDAAGGDLLLLLADEYSEEQALSEQTVDGVVVSTIHGAKGREWSTVFLPVFEQQTIPGTAKSRDIEEERRLAYVAITRARHKLIITFCRERRPAFGSSAPMAADPSQFIAEAGLDRIEEGVTNGHHD